MPKRMSWKSMSLYTPGTFPLFPYQADMPADQVCAAGMHMMLRNLDAPGVLMRHLIVCVLLLFTTAGIVARQNRIDTANQLAVEIRYSSVFGLFRSVFYPCSIRGQKRFLIGAAAESGLEKEWCGRDSHTGRTGRSAISWESSHTAAQLQAKSSNLF